MQGVSLADAVAEVNRLEGEREKIIARRDAHSARFRTYCEKLESRFKKEPTIENEVAARIARIVADEDAKRAGPRHPALYGQFYEAEAQAVWSEFVKREPAWQKALKTLSAGRLEAAETELAEIETKIRHDFTVAGFDNEAVENDPRIKRAKRRVERAEMLDAMARDAAGYKAWESLYKDLTGTDEG